MDYCVIIGLEIHVQLNTKSKIFSSASNSFNHDINSNISINDFGFPGILPVINKQVIVDAIQICNALHMDIERELWFERKNYFYSDLSKGYQITQEKRPIGRNGYLMINNRRYPIQRLHIEEDTSKQTHDHHFTFLDMNRSGVPLVEIVTDPIFDNGYDAMMFVKKIRSIVSSLGVSSGRLEEGSMRCDVNVSVQPKDLRYFGNKVEIKNLNTFNNIEKAIEYEKIRQLELIQNRKVIEQETRRYDEEKEVTVLMRKKSDSIDYRYFTDPNIPPIQLSEEFIKNAISLSKELEDDRLNRLLSLEINESIAKQIAEDKDLTDYFDLLMKARCSPKLSANFLINEIKSCLNKKNINILKFNVSPSGLSELLFLIETNKVSNKEARLILDNMIDKGESCNESYASLGLGQKLDSKDIQTAINDVIKDNPNSVRDYKNGLNKAAGHIIGLVIKKLDGKCNPKIIKDMVIDELSRR